MMRPIAFALLVLMVVGPSVHATPPDPARASPRVETPLDVDGVCARPGAASNRCGRYALFDMSPLEKELRTIRRLEHLGTDEARAEATKRRQRLNEARAEAMKRLRELMKEREEQPAGRIIEVLR